MISYWKYENILLESSFSEVPLYDELVAQIFFIVLCNVRYVLTAFSFIDVAKFISSECVFIVCKGQW